MSIASITAPLPIALQPINTMQSNDLIYRGVLDVTAWDISVYTAARNKDEKRERAIELSLSTLFGFVLVPLSTLLFNHLFSSQLPQKNSLFFNLAWPHLDAGEQATAIAHLTGDLQRTQKRLEKPSWFFDELGWVKQQLTVKKTNLEKAIELIRETPDSLKQVRGVKKSVLLSNLLLSTLALSLISPTKQLVTQVFSHTDRFTGSENYLSDEDSKKLTNGSSRKKQQPFKLACQALLVMIPAAVALGTHHWVDKAVQEGKSVPPYLLTIRNSMDYTNGIYLTLGGLFAIFMANNINDFVWARDRYELLETIVKYSVACPSFFYGDHVFNGNLAKVADKALSQAGHFKPNTFIEKAHTSWLGGEAKFIQKVVDDVTADEGDKKGKQAGNVASLIFLMGFMLHSVAMTSMLAITNTFTKRWITKDLAGIQQNTTPKNNKTTPTEVIPSATQ